MFAIQGAIDALPAWGGSVVVSEPVQIFNSVRLRSGVTVRGGNGRGGSIVEVMTPGIDAFIIESEGDARTECSVEDLTVRTRCQGVTGIRSTRSGANEFSHLTFQGCARSINIDQGLANVVDTVWSETWDDRPAGQLMVWSSDPSRYAQYVTVRAYQSLYGTAGPAVIFYRATNVTAHVQIHEPGQDGILVTDDCQGITLAGCIVKPNTGVVMSGTMERRPSFIDTRGLSIDQAQAIGVVVYAGTDLDLGGAITNGANQGILMFPYPLVERYTIDARLAMHGHDAIVVEPGGQYFSVVGASACGSKGAGLVISGGAPSGNFTVAHNDFSQGNAAGFVDASGGGPNKLVTGNR